MVKSHLKLTEQKSAPLVLAFFTLVAALLIGSHARADSHTFSADHLKCRVDLPTGWRLVPDAFGMNALLVSPDTPRTTTIGVILSPMKAQGFDSTTLQKELLEFKRQKLSWLQSRGYQLTAEFESAANNDIEGSVEVLFGYRVGTKEQFEITDFFIQNNIFYHIKTLLPGTRAETRFKQKTTKTIVRSLTCIPN